MRILVFLLLLLVPACAEASCLGSVPLFRGQPALPVGLLSGENPTDPGWLLNISRMSPPSSTIIYMGDSLTSQLVISAASAKGVNVGVPGDLFRSMLNRLTGTPGITSCGAVRFMGGINDLAFELAHAAGGQNTVCGVSVPHEYPPEDLQLFHQWLGAYVISPLVVWKMPHVNTGLASLSVADSNIEIDAANACMDAIYSNRPNTVVIDPVAIGFDPKVDTISGDGVHFSASGQMKVNAADAAAFHMLGLQ